MKKALERLFPNLASKVLVAVVVALFVTAATIVFLAHQTGYKMLEKQIWAKAHVAADFGKAILEHIMLEGDVDQLQSALEMAITAHQVDDVLILKSDGTVPLSVNNKYRFQKFPLEQFREIPGADDNRYMSVWENGSRYEYIVSPIIKKPECYRCHKESEPVQGYLAVKIRMDDLRVISSEHRTRNIVMTLLVFCGLGGVIFLALVILVTKPIGQLHSHMRRIEEEIGKLERGEASHYPLLKVPERNDEIADLGRTFNNLLSRLNDATAKLRDMHERQLEQADRLVTVGEMAASLAHEIKNPLAGILGALQVIDGETPENDPRREVISQMLGQLDRMNRTVDDLLSYARPSSPVIKEVEINGLIEGIIPFLQRQVKGKEIAFQSDLMTDHVTVSCDSKLLQQVLWNIMLNAVHAIKTSGTVTIRTRKEDSFLKIEITDTGEGIAPENLQRIFEPFFTTKHKGTGLGLAISKRIVETHHGTIDITSEPGEGTRVTMRIPIRQPQPEK